MQVPTTAAEPISTLGWIFMLVSVVSVTCLTLWCFKKVLGEPSDG